MIFRIMYRYMYLHADMGVNADRLAGNTDVAEVALVDEADDCSAGVGHWYLENPLALQAVPTTESDHRAGVLFVSGNPCRLQFSRL